MIETNSTWGVTPDTILSVGNYTLRLKALLEGTVPPSWIRGEVSNLRQQASGHYYFTLKDAESQLPVVLFKGIALQQSVRLREGMQLIIYGEISLYEPRGTYQLIARCLLEEGQGRLGLEFERLKQKLQTEGLFDPARKKTLPAFPKTIGIITSPTGAALHDFVKILERRHWKGTIILFPSKVQGTGAMAEIVKQIRKASSFRELDLLVIARGGGSLEDLWCFNEEMVVRALAHSSIPTLSAIGHEIDFTLSDFVADLRAETPSAAAVWIANQSETLGERYNWASHHFLTHIKSALATKAHTLALLQEYIKRLHPRHCLENAALRLDDLQSRLKTIFTATLLEAKNHLREAKQRLENRSPEAHITLQTLHVKILKERFQQQSRLKIEAAAKTLSYLRTRLSHTQLDHLLARGFIYLTNANGQVVTQQAPLQTHEPLTGHFADGTRPLIVK